MSTLEQAILDTAQARGPAASFSPEEAARAFAGDDWRRVLGEVRKTAVRLALDGRIVILRKGKPADPHAFKGVYRLRAAQ
jgi:hypothetical protein